MNDPDRDFAIQYLEQTRDRLLAFAGSIPMERRDYRRAESDWSAAGLIEHIILVETWALRQAEVALPNESRRGKGGHKDRMILEGMPARNEKVQAPESSYPTSRWPDWDTLIQEFIAIRTRVIEFARTATTDLRIHFSPHPFFRDLDQYQWLVLIGAHGERHVRQAEELLQ